MIIVLDTHRKRTLILIIERIIRPLHIERFTRPIPKVTSIPRGISRIRSLQGRSTKWDPESNTVHHIQGSRSYVRFRLLSRFFSLYLSTDFIVKNICPSVFEFWGASLSSLMMSIYKQIPLIKTRLQSRLEQNRKIH